MKNKSKRAISLFLMMVMLMSSFTGVLAENINTIPKTDSDVTVEAPPETVPEATPEVTPSPRPEVSPSPSPEVSPETSPEITPEPSPEASPEISPNPSPEASAKPSPEVSPSPSSEPTTPTEEKTFTPLAIKDETKSIDAAIGDTVEFFVTLNRDDVNVRYQWQKNCTPPEEEKLYGTEKEVLSEDELADKEIFSSGGYQWLIDDVSEAEWLVDHPDIIWQGKDLWDEAVELAGGDTSKVHIPNGAKSIADVAIDGMTITSEGVV